MKKILSKLWMRCAILFILLLALNAVRWRLFPGDDPEGGNLLVNVVMAGGITGMYAVTALRLRRNRRYKEDVQRRLNNK